MPAENTGFLREIVKDWSFVYTNAETPARGRGGKLKLSLWWEGLCGYV